MKKELPTLETLLHQANILLGRYASQDAYEQALSSIESNNAPASLKIKFGPPSASGNANRLPVDTGTEIDESSEFGPPSLPTENVPKVHKEADGFDGDRVLANSILFLQDFGWWTEIAYAVPEDDIGRVFEIMKVSNLAMDSD